MAAPPPLQKAQDRLALHEIIRVGMGRQEDLRLLQNVSARPYQPRPDACPGYQRTQR